MHLCLRCSPLFPRILWLPSCTYIWLNRAPHLTSISRSRTLLSPISHRPSLYSGLTERWPYLTHTRAYFLSIAQTDKWVKRWKVSRRMPYICSVVWLRRNPHDPVYAEKPSEKPVSVSTALAGNSSFVWCEVWRRKLVSFSQGVHDVTYDLDDIQVHWGMLTSVNYTKTFQLFNLHK